MTPASPTGQSTPLLEVVGLEKAFGHVQALRGVSFAVRRGEVIGLVGDNGAGKSTLVGCLSGVVNPDAGTICLDGQATTIADPLAAHALGIETVYQDLSLALDLEPAANIFLGQEVVRRGLPGRLGALDWSVMRPQASAALEEIGIRLPNLTAPTSRLSGGQRQAVAIARAVKWARRLILMDEPTAALGVAQSAIVLRTIRTIRDLGTPIVLISHNLHDIFQVADRIVVMRLGSVVADLVTGQVRPDDVVAAITGARGVA